MNMPMRATTAMLLTATLGACATSGPMATRGPSSDERMFATTFASCRDQVRAGKTDAFKISPASPMARGTPAGDTGLRLKAPYDRVKSGKSHRGQNAAVEAATDACLAANGYSVS